MDAGAKQVMIIKVLDDKAENIAERFEASLNYLRNKSLEIRIEESETFDFEKIQKEAKENLKRNPNIDSIIAPSDIHAIAYIHEILAIGKKIPDDIQIMVMMILYLVNLFILLYQLSTNHHIKWENRLQG